MNDKIFFNDYKASLELLLESENEDLETFDYLNYEEETERAYRAMTANIEKNNTKK